MRIIVLTGSETRHDFFRVKLALDKRFEVAKAYCEGKEKSLERKVLDNATSSKIEVLHVMARKQSENDFFGLFLQQSEDRSNPKYIAKGEINNEDIVAEIVELKPDLLVCYGASLIRSKLTQTFKGNFINIHLGLSPYYKGSGTNIWPLINKEPHMVGATFMHIDEGIDTGEIVHQIRADIFLGDSPHSIGNRLITQMTSVCCDIIANFTYLRRESQPSGSGKTYKQNDFCESSCNLLYDNFEKGMIRDFILNADPSQWPEIVQNKGLMR